MTDHDILFPKISYPENLTTIQNIYFTPREVDIIACLFNARGTSRTASLLNIAPRTVVTHIRNIMQKLGCGSRESILDFIEKSGTVPYLRRHYAHLLVNETFEKCLKDLCKIKYESSPTYIVLDVKNTNLNEALRDYFFFDFKKAGIEVDVIEENGLLIVRNGKETLGSQVPTVFEEQENYYLLFFEIAEKFYSHMKIKSIVDDFRKKYAINIKGTELLESFACEAKDQIKITPKSIFNKLLQKKLLYGFIAFCCGFLMITTFLIFYDSEKLQPSQIRSDLIIPKESALLQRDELLKQIDDKFKNQNGIKTVALIGPGGAGKTTLARQYAHEQKENVIWEINAETHESLTSSFESLAQALVKTEGDKNPLKKIQDIKDAEAKEEKIIQFVKKHLSSHSDWFLIFDNVEKFTDIQKYFPQDFATWGKGKVILTTRNSNIQNNEHINFTLSVGELLSHQKLHLFTQIMKNNSSPFTSKQIEEAKKFLENIPSFPLDISIAAYYLKETNISYTTYLKNLANYNKDFVNIQETLLREVGGYNKTRYGIIILSIQNLIDTHKDFKELLLFISLLDSQNIPRDLLNNFKNSEVVNNFIINLKKYSLITNEALASSINSTLTIHRSTQEIILNYLIYNIHLRKDDKMMQQIVFSIENYIDNIIESEAVTLIQSMIKHCKKILSYNYLLTDNMVYSLKSKLGNMYYYSNASLNIEAKRILEDNIKYLKTHHIKNKNAINDLIYLCLIYSEIDERKKLKQLADYTLVNYTKTLSEKTSKSAWALSFLGNMYDDLGDYECAKELLEKSCNLYKEYFSDDHVGRTRSLAYLGNVYRKLGNYQYAKKVLEESYEICKKNFLDNHFRTGWTLVALGNVYLYLGDYKKSTYLLTESVNIYKKYEHL
jgi:DNA-binding CsgD family transcriptional regulator